ncbi:MAG: glycoside hydrolase family 9 protein [Bryobacteraceae bacterium]|jgi:endoglucanase
MKPIVLLLTCCSAFAAASAKEIKVDQAGYLPGAPKVALVVSGDPATDFAVRRAADGSVAFRGKLGAPVEDADTGDRVQAADFTKLARRGTYYLDVAGLGRSWDFAIGPDVFSRAWYLAMRSFYGQRCGTAVDLGPEFPGYAYSACHLKGAYHPSCGRTGPQTPVKGWHDAGDYGRYVVNSGITTGTLLWTWELFGARIKNIKLNIPESGNGTPDILNEIRWNLDWMLSMQDQDGGVWQKQTSDRFCGFVMPDKDTRVSYVVGTGKEPYKSSCATADFAAVMAIAARVYEPFDAAYARKCLRAARQAWGWLDKYPDVTFRNPSGVQSGVYGDADCGDERLWASAELWRTTGEDVYHRHFLAHFGEYRETVRSVPGEGWAHVAPLGLWTYVLGKGRDAAAVAAIRQDSIAAADQFVERSGRNGYRIGMTSKDYVWGSNGVAANYGVQLLVANAIRRDPRYVQAALDHLHYLLGRNTFSLSWVTQVGANPYRHPHHRPSGAEGAPGPWPGLLAGGPNRGRQDPLLRKLPADLGPAKVYVDDQASYASNEVAINWNAALVFLLAGVMPEK